MLYSCTYTSPVTLQQEKNKKKKKSLDVCVCCCVSYCLLPPFHSSPACPALSTNLTLISQKLQISFCVRWLSDDWCTGDLSREWTHAGHGARDARECPPVRCVLWGSIFGCDDVRLEQTRERKRNSTPSLTFSV